MVKYRIDPLFVITFCDNVNKKIFSKFFQYLLNKWADPSVGIERVLFFLNILYLTLSVYDLLNRPQGVYYFKYSQTRL